MKIERAKPAETMAERARAFLNSPERCLRASASETAAEIMAQFAQSEVARVRREQNGDESILIVEAFAQERARIRKEQAAALREFQIWERGFVSDGNGRQARSMGKLRRAIDAATKPTAARRARR